MGIQEKITAAQAQAQAQAQAKTVIDNDTDIVEHEKIVLAASNSVATITSTETLDIYARFGTDYASLATTVYKLNNPTTDSNYNPTTSLDEIRGIFGFVDGKSTKEEGGGDPIVMYDANGNPFYDVEKAIYKVISTRKVAVD